MWLPSSLSPSGVLQVTVNMEAAAVSHGAPSTVTAPVPATVEPPVTAVRTWDFPLTVWILYVGLFVSTPVHIFSVTIRAEQQMLSSPNRDLRNTNQNTTHRHTKMFLWLLSAKTENDSSRHLSSIQRCESWNISTQYSTRNQKLQILFSNTLFDLRVHFYCLELFLYLFQIKKTQNALKKDSCKS